MANKKYPPINLETHSLFSIYAYPKFGNYEDRIRETAYSLAEAMQVKADLKKEGYTRIMALPVKYQHDKEYRNKINVNQK